MDPEGSGSAVVHLIRDSWLGLVASELFQILMFEHVRSRIGPIGIFLDLMTPLSRLVGPDLNRDTVGNVQKAGFRIRYEENVYLDCAKVIEGLKPEE